MLSFVRVADVRCLRSPRLKRAGVPVQLPLNRFHLRDHRFPDEAVPGGLPQVEHSGSCGTLPVTRRASPSTEYLLLFERRQESPTSCTSRVRVARQTCTLVLLPKRTI